MKTTKGTQAGRAFSADDDLYPTEITFANGCSVRLASSEDGKIYLRVEWEEGGQMASKATPPPVC